MRCDKLCLLYKSREQHLPSPLSQHDYLIQISYVDRKRGQCGTPSSMRWKAPRNEDASRSKWKVSFATGNRKVSFAEAVGLIFHLHSAVSAGAPQAIQVADRFHVAKNLSETVQQLLARVLLEMKLASQGAEAATQARGDRLLPIEEWRPVQEESVKQAIATRRAERQERYQQVLALCEQGLTSQEIAVRLGMKARTVREWLHKGVAPDTRPRRKYRSEFDLYD